MSNIQTTHRFRCDLSRGPCEVKLPIPLMHQDAQADVFRVSVCRGSSPIDLSGMIACGYLYYASTRQTMPLFGSISGHYVTVTMPESGYAIPGHASLVIQLQQEDVRHTVLKVDFCIERTGSESILTPEDALPSLADLMALIAGQSALQSSLDWADLALYSSQAQATLLEAGIPVFVQDVQAVLDGLQDGQASLLIGSTMYTLRGLGNIHDTLMYKDGALQLCRKVNDSGTALLPEYAFQTIPCDNLSAVIGKITLPCSPTQLLAKSLTRITYADCGAHLDGEHDDYEAMYRAHFIGGYTGCTVEQHGGTIYKACSGWLIIRDHDIDLSGSTLLINDNNRSGCYWLNAPTQFEDEGLPLRSEMVEHSAQWTSAETNFPANGIFEITRPADATRYENGQISTLDRKELVRHGSDGLVYSTVIDDAKDNTIVQYIRYPDTRLTFTGCTLNIDLSSADAALFFLRCERSNALIRDFVIEPSRRTTMNIGYRGAVFTLNRCADVTLENIQGINVAGYPSEDSPIGVSGYLLSAACVLNLLVKGCNLLGYWGATGLNGAKNVTFDGCELNRVDIHDYFANLTVNDCRLYRHAISIGYGKGVVNVTNCAILTGEANQIIHLRCDYGRYFEGQINISGVDAVYTGTGHFDIVSGTPLYSAESAAATGLFLRKYPGVNITNAAIHLVGGGTAGYILHMPEDLESTVEVTDTRKVIECANLAAYDADNTPVEFTVCSLDGVVQSQTTAITKIQTIFGIDEGEIEQVDRVVRPDKHVPKDLLNIPNMKVYVQSSKYAYALYTVDPSQTYYVTGSAHSNTAEYPIGGFYDSDGVLISMFGTNANEVYTKQPIQPPENAVLMAVNKTVQSQAIEVTIKVTLTGSALLDGVIAQAEETANRVDEFLEQYEKDNTPSIGPAITPDSTVEGQIYDVVNLEGYGSESDYGHSFYMVTGGNQYFVTCASATNVDNYPGGAFYDADGNLLSTVCDKPLTRYTDHLVKAPAAAATLVLNKNAGIPAAVCKVGIESAQKSAASKTYDLGMADAIIRLEKKNPFTFAAFDKGYISFVFDDLTDDLDGIAATFEEFGVPLCIAAIPEKLDNIAASLTEARGSYTVGMPMREIMHTAVSLGGEIMGHNTDVITAENQYDYEFMYAHVVNCRSSLEAAGFKPRGFIRAGGDGAINSSAEIERWLVGNFEYSNQGVSPQYSQERVTINQTLDALKASIDACASGNTWLRFMCHGYAYGGGTTFASENDLREILTYAQSKGVGIVTWAHMFDTFGSTKLDEYLKNA